MNRQTAIAKGVSMFEMNIHAPDGKMLKSSAGNTKLSGKGRRKYIFTKGAHKGLPLYSLTLEERKTCDISCIIWDRCYGNHMYQGKRYIADENLAPALATELEILDAKHPNGISVRLHVLGDFFSIEYVQFWKSQLMRFPNLHVWGYTHRTGEIRREIHKTWIRFQNRFNILQSDSLAGKRPSAYLETTKGSENFILCPEQSGATESCLSCGLCCSAKFKGVMFAIH
jgi:hypothetical protein